MVTNTGTISTENPTATEGLAGSGSAALSTIAPTTVPARTVTSTTPITPEEVASSDTISDLRLSKDGTRVIYTSGPLYKAGEHKVSALWVADTFVRGSARQITSGANRDYAPSFHPHSSTEIYFLSDRDKPGGSIHLFRASVDLERLGSGSDWNLVVQPVVTLGDRQSVGSYSISPDGRYLAFTVEEKALMKGEKEIIQIWRENKNFQTLNIVDLLEGSNEDHRSLTVTMRYAKSFDSHHRRHA